MTSDHPVSPEISIVIPIFNESANIETVVAEVEATLRDGPSFELILVDDGSDDGTRMVLTRLAQTFAQLRFLRLGARCGKSAALRLGVAAARSDVVVTMDGDGQSDPTAIPRLLSEFHDAGPDCGLVAGQRLGRHGTAFRRFQSKVANVVRSAVLGDDVRDTGCGLKCFPRDVFLDLPFFDGLHLFLPALVRREGYAISLIDVVDRPRLSGDSKQGFFGRLGAGIADLFGVVWLIARRRNIPDLIETETSPPS